MHVGSATTWGEDLVVTGNARVTGILTVGTGTIEIDGSNNKINVGAGITIDASSNQILIGNSKVADDSGDAQYVGIVTASQFIIGVGGTNVATALGEKASIGLAIALG